MKHLAIPISRTLIVQTIKFQLELTQQEDIYLEENNQT